MPERHDLICPQLPTRPRPRKLAACAAVDDTDYLAGEVVSDTGGFYFATALDFANRFFTAQWRGYTLLVHDANEMMYALLPQVQHLAKQGYTAGIICNGAGAVISIKVTAQKQVWRIQDTHALIDLPLSELHTLTGDQPPSTIVGTAQLILDAYHSFSHVIRASFGIDPDLTIGATSVRAWRTTIPAGHVFYRHRKPIEQAARSAYFGGLSFQRTTEVEQDMVHVDCNGAFAHAMLQGVPVRGGVRTMRERPGKAAVYRCVVTCPSDIAIPFVPVRSAMSHNRAYSLQPGAQAECWLTSNIVEAARGAGYTVDVLDGYTFPLIERIFDKFVNRCQQLENQLRDQGARQIIKALRNSLPGKFGQKTTFRTYYLTEQIERGMTPVIDFKGNIIENLYYTVSHVERSYCMPVWAAWITSNARINLMHSTDLVGQEHISYMDTDSIVMEEEAASTHWLPMGTQYGEWKHVATYSDWQVLHPKTYRGVDRDTGEITQATAGITTGLLNEKDWGELAEHLTVKKVVTQQAPPLSTLTGRPRSRETARTIQA